MGTIPHYRKTNSSLVLVLLSCALTTSAQHETDKWYFGSDGEGLDFTDHCDAVALYDGETNGFEGCATVADRNTGELLFYTNSQSVVGRDHLQMPNGNLHVPGAAGESTITQVLITARPGSQSQYYLFTNQVQGGFFGGGGMRLACVDMTLNNGFGDVLFKDSVIYADTVSEKVIAVRHANDTDLWVIGHGYPNDEFFAIRMTPQGPEYPAVLSHVGKHYHNFTMDCLGEMKADPIGDKIAVVTAGQPHIELFQFNRTSGVVSGPVVINSPEISGGGNSWLYGVSFSPDGTKLYAGRKNFGIGVPSLIQVDVSSFDSLQIAASYAVISTLDSIYSVHLAANGKIYTRRSGLYLGAINHPDNAGLTCDFDPQAVMFQGVPSLMGTWGFNNNITLLNYPCIKPIGMVDGEQVAHMSVYPVPSDGTITLRLERIPQGREIVLRDVLGRTFDRQRIWDLNTTLTIAHSGVWIIELWDEFTCISTQRVIVE